MNTEELKEISGTVDNVIFRSDETGFTVLELNTGSELLITVGEFAEVEEGEELTVRGSYSVHPNYGEQFKAQMYERKMPSTVSAIIKYLSSGAIKGIGPVTARRIVDAFGTQTLEIMENDPIRLASVQGISIKKAESIGEEFRQLFGVRSVMLFLANYGITPAQSVKIWKKWGMNAVDIIKENPYALCSEAFGIGFSLCDEIAQKMEYPLDSINRIKAAIGYVLSRNMLNGHTCLPADKLTDAAASVLNLDINFVADALYGLIEQKIFYSVQRNKLYIYLPSLLTAENYIAARISIMLADLPCEYKNIDKTIDDFEKLEGIKYAGLQRKAIKEALANHIMILTGGPGTGKTTTLNGIIKLFESEGKKVLITAPTGRAAKRISELTGKDAKTVHRMLEVKYEEEEKSAFVYNENKPLECDVVIVDEMSMMDTLLFDSLLKAIPMRAKLIMVGDSDQLPSVGAGNVLKDMIESGVVPSVRLTEIFRQSASSMIVSGAHDIVNGVMPDLNRTDNDFFFIGRSDVISVQTTVVELCSSRLPRTYGFSCLDDIEVLCPGRKGKLGCAELNKLIQEVINPHEANKTEFKANGNVFRTGDKVMQIKNNYDIPWVKENEKGLGVFNGDIGIIKSIDKLAQTAEIDFYDRTAAYSFENASELDLAYATTVHKSQGSEFNAVIIPVFGGYDKLYFRNLLYTAVTRAKKILILVGSRGRIKYMIDNNIKTLRYTGLRYFLENGIVG